MSNSRIAGAFWISVALELLATGSPQVLLSLTQDRVDTEIKAVPLTVVPHAPEILISLPSSDSRFLLPEFHVEERLQEYNLCGDSNTDALSQVHATIADRRFVVKRDMKKIGEDCNGKTAKMLILTAVREESSGCGDWCGSYRTRGQGFDVKVTQSFRSCLKEAWNLLNFSAIERIAEHATSCEPGAKSNLCVA